MTKLEASGLALLGGASYGLLSGLTKLAYISGVATGPLTIMQNLTGALLLWLAASLLTRGQGRPGGKEILMLLSTGALPGLTGAFYYLALAVLPASLGIVLLFQFTWLGVALEWLLSGQRPGPSRWLALLFLLPGTALAAGIIGTAWQWNWQGIALALLAAFAYTAYLAAAGRVALQVSPWWRSTWISTGSLLATSIFFALVAPGHSGPWTALLWYGGLMGLFGVLLPNLCFAYGVPVIGGGLAGILGAVELPVVLLMAAMVLGETVTVWQWLGAVLMLVGIYLGEKGEHYFKKSLEY